MGQDSRPRIFSNEGIAIEKQLFNQSTVLSPQFTNRKVQRIDRSTNSISHWFTSRVVVEGYAPLVFFLITD